MDAVTLPLPVILGIAAYLVAATAYIVKGAMAGSQNAKDLCRLEKWQVAHDEAQRATVDRQWTQHEELKNRVTYLEAKLNGHGAE